MTFFSSSNWIYPIIFFPEKRKLIFNLKPFILKREIYELETRIKEILFDFSKLIEEGLWDTTFIYLINYLNFHIFEYEIKEKRTIFKDICWEVFTLTKKKLSEVRNKIVIQITNASQIVVDNKKGKKLFDFVNILLEKHKIISKYCSKSSKESNIAALLLKFPWYKDYLGFIWIVHQKLIDKKINAKMILKLLLLNDLNLQEKSTFAKVDEFIDEYGGWSGVVVEKDSFKLLEILGFIFNEVKSNSYFGEIIGVFKKLKEEQISLYAQKTRQKLLVSKKTFFLKKDLKSEEIESMFLLAKRIRNFASHTQSTKQFTNKTKNKQTPIECMLDILEKIEFEDNKKFLYFRFDLKTHLVQICNLHKKGVFSVFENYSSENVLRDIKNLFFGEEGSKHFLLNLTKEEQDEVKKNIVKANNEIQYDF